MYPEFRLSHTGSSMDAQDVMLNYCISIAARVHTKTTTVGSTEGTKDEGSVPTEGTVFSCLDLILKNWYDTVRWLMYGRYCGARGTCFSFFL